MNTNEIYQAAFADELKKIGYPVSLGRSFFAGFDPTGTKTFALSQDSKRHKAHQISGLAGGLIGGATIIPSAVTGAIGAIRGFASSRGGSRTRIVGAARGFGKGAIAPYKQLYHGIKGTKALKSAISSGKLSSEGATHIHKALGLSSGGAAIKNKKFINMIPSLKGSEGMREVHQLVKRQTTQAAAGLGASSALSGASSIMQYRQGRDIGDERRRAWASKR